MSSPTHVRMSLSCLVQTLLFLVLPPQACSACTTFNGIWNLHMQACDRLRPGVDVFGICVDLRNHLFFLCLGVASRAASVSSAAALAASHRAMLCLVLSLASRLWLSLSQLLPPAAGLQESDHANQHALPPQERSRSSISLERKIRCSKCLATQVSVELCQLACTQDTK